MKHGTNATMNHSDLTKRVRAALALAAFVLFAALALAACSSHAIDGPELLGDGTGSLSIRIAGSDEARLIMPTVPTAETIAHYEATLSREGYATRTSGQIADLSSFTMQALEPGDWALSLAGFDASGTKLAEGTATVTIEQDTTVTVTIILAPAFARTVGGTGTLSLSFSCEGFLASTDAWSVVFAPCAGGSSVSFTNTSASGVTVNSALNTIALSTTLPSGDWDMTFTVTRGGVTYVRLSDTVKIYDGKASTFPGGAAVAISLADLVKAERVRYVSNTAVTGNTGYDRAHACKLIEATTYFNERGDLTEADPGLIILTENVVYLPLDPTEFLPIKKPMKIISLASAPSPLALILKEFMTNCFFIVQYGSGNTGALTLERVTVRPSTELAGYGAGMGLIMVAGTDGNAKLTLNEGATVTGNLVGYDTGGVNLSGGTLVMNPGSTITGNKAQYGGGVRLTISTDEFVMKGGTISGNTAVNAGGGVYSDASLATVRLNGGTITGNTVKDGGTGSFGPGAGVCLYEELADSLSCTVAGGWKSVVFGNTGVGPDLVRQFPVSDPSAIGGLRDLIETSHGEPVWINLVSSIDLSSMSMAALHDNNQIVISSVTGNYLAAPSGRSTSAFQVPSTSSLWFDVEYVGASSSTAPVFTVIGGTLVLDAKCQITDNKIAGASYGGAINASAGSVEMRGGEIASCKASRGGAIHLSGTATFAMTGGILTNNEAVSAGAVWLEGNAKMMMSGTALIQNNTATGYTGGIVLNANAELEIVGSTPKIKTNNGGSASNGGTGVLLYNETTTLTCTGSTWKDVILDDNIPTEMPSLTRRLLVTNQDQLISALSDTSIPVCVDISGYTIDIDRTFNIHGIVLLKGNNPTDTLIRDPSFTGTLLSVESDGILILPLYVVIDGNSITASAPLIDVKLGGTLNMRNGSTHLINANTSGNGGAVSVAGTFLFKDGLIGGSGTPNNAQKGGGVYIASGGVMTMTGGAVTYNSSVMEGAGVYVDNGGTFNYSDGIIHSNQSTMTSDGIYLDGILNIGTPGLVFSGIDLNDGFGLYVTLNGVVRIDLGSGLQVMPAGSASSTSLFLDIFGPDNTSGPYHFDGL